MPSEEGAGTLVGVANAGVGAKGTIAGVDSKDNLAKASSKRVKVLVLDEFLVHLMLPN